MTADRDIANAISDGINSIAELASALDRETCDGPKPATPEWPSALEAMERALEAVIAGEVTTSLVIHSEDVERIRRIRAFVSEWLTSGHVAKELKALVANTLRSFPLPIDNTGEDQP